MKNTFKEAHKLTKEMVTEYGTDYQAQFGLCLSYLLGNKEEEEMLDLKGTENQVKYANDIIKDIEKMFEDLDQLVEDTEKKKKRFNRSKDRAIKALHETEDAKEVIETFKSVIYIEETLGKALKASEIFANKMMYGQAVFTDYIDQKHYDRYYDKIDNL